MSFDVILALASSVCMVGLFVALVVISLFISRQKR